MGSSSRAPTASRRSFTTGFPLEGEHALHLMVLPLHDDNMAAVAPSGTSFAGRHFCPVTEDYPSSNAFTSASSGFRPPRRNRGFSIPDFGEITRWAKSPSFVSSSRPLVSLSSRPTGNRPMRRISDGRMSSTVSCRLSSVALSTPSGLIHHKIPQPVRAQLGSMIHAYAVPLLLYLHVRPHRSSTVDRDASALLSSAAARFWSQRPALTAVCQVFFTAIGHPSAVSKIFCPLIIAYLSANLNSLSPGQSHLLCLPPQHTLLSSICRLWRSVPSGADFASGRMEIRYDAKVLRLY